MKILKKGGSREKGGGGNEIHAPCACGKILHRHMHSVKKNSGRVTVFNATFSNILNVFYRGDQFYLWWKPRSTRKNRRPVVSH